MQTKKVFKNFFTPKNNYERFSLQVYNLLVENFSKTFFVGGMVRDLFLHKKISDVDIVTEATPDQVISLFKNHNYKFEIKGKTFGVIKIISQSGDIEITTMRSEVYTNSRYPKVKFIKNLALDSKRRDFSINSLYFQGKLAIVYDPQNGLLDLAKKQIKIIGQAKSKLEQDPLRIVRAYRFVKELNFRFDPNTQTSLEKYFPLVEKISKTKLQSEINKSKNNFSKKYLQQLFKKLLI